MFLNQLTEEEKKSFIQLAYYIATKDDKYATEEKQIIEQYAIEMNIRIDDVINETEIDVDSLIRLFENSKSDIVKKVFIELMGLVLVDKEYNESEEKLLIKYVEIYSLGSEYLKAVKKWVEKMNDLYQELTELI